MVMMSHSHKSTLSLTLIKMIKPVESPFLKCKISIIQNFKFLSVKLLRICADKLSKSKKEAAEHLQVSENSLACFSVDGLSLAQRVMEKHEADLYCSRCYDVCFIVLSSNLCKGIFSNA